MDGKVVQLAQGREKALEGGTPEEMLARFSGLSELQVIDIDAALDRGNNNAVVALLAARARARIGGGVRTVDHALQLVRCGAHRIIIGTSAFHEEGANTPFLAALARHRP
jgi:phosphoribosylformimino-5-aminoimidazole carboxamide ribonucleotide (ProFAR) isomerase